jgi:hypothetical protein
MFWLMSGVVAVGMAALALAMAGWQMPPIPGVDNGVSDRFPRRPPDKDAPRAARAADAGVPTETTPGDPASCSTVDPEARMSCPLSGGQVTRQQHIPYGVRLSLRQGGLSADRLEATLRCQVALGAVRPDVPPACPFLSPPPEVSVRVLREGLLGVDLRWPGADEGTVGRYRQRVETALAPPSEGKAGKTTP